jgi:hypothetical protein
MKSVDRLLTDKERRILWEQQQEGWKRSEEKRDRERQASAPIIEEKPKTDPPRYNIVFAEFLLQYPKEIAHAKTAEWVE